MINNKIIYKEAPFNIDISKLPNYGLQHTSSELDEMYNVIYTLPIRKIATYADNVTMFNVNEDWLKDQIIRNINSSKSHREKYYFSNMKTTAAGNMAYIALYCNDQYVGNMAYKILQEYQKYRKNQESILPKLSNCLIIAGIIFMLVILLTQKYIKVQTSKIKIS
jgi:hypothetical protein